MAGEEGANFGGGGRRQLSFLERDDVQALDAQISQHLLALGRIVKPAYLLENTKEFTATSH